MEVFILRFSFYKEQDEQEQGLYMEVCILRFPFYKEKDEQEQALYTYIYLVHAITSAVFTDGKTRTSHLCLYLIILIIKAVGSVDG